MTQTHLPNELGKIVQGYPRFPDQRIDYTNERVCPVLNCTVIYKGEALLTYRSADVIAYPETWNGISGFIDEIKPLEEETGITPESIEQIVIRNVIIQNDYTIGREWHVFPALVILKDKPVVVTNWENKEAKWVSQGEVLQLELMPFYAETFIAAMGGVANVNEKEKL